MPSTSVFEQPKRKGSEPKINGPVTINGRNYRARDCGEYIACTRDVDRGTPRPPEVDVETPAPGGTGKRRWWIFLFTLLAGVACIAVYYLPGL